MKAVMILLDSLNRRFLDCYGSAEGVPTPNIDRLARRSVVFDNHWCGSSPCMPARRDLMTGRLGFLERPWGGIEPFDHTLTSLLREQNVFSHMETDHQFYNELGGENYLNHFTSWRMHRGTEHDTIHWRPDEGGIRRDRSEGPAGYVGMYSDPYEFTRRVWDGRAENYSTPQTLTGAARWLEENHGADNYFLWVEGFDPHEPFDVPEQFLEPFGPPLSPEDCWWPDYVPGECYTQAQIANFRRRYKGLLAMTDHYLGGLIDVLDRHGMWEDTVVILTTDHGYLLGEHGFVAKNIMPDYNELSHLPLLVAAPGVAPGRRDAITQNIDLFPSLLEWFRVPRASCRNPIHGKSLWPVLRGETEVLHEAVLYGIFGKSVNLFDGRYTYLRRAAGDNNAPLYLYGAMPTLLRQYIGLDTMSDREIAGIEAGRFLSWTNYPVFKVPAGSCHWTNNALAFENLHNLFPSSLLFDLRQDYAQERPLTDPDLTARMDEALARCMREHDSPAEQFVRLGLAT